MVFEPHVLVDEPEAAAMGSEFTPVMIDLFFAASEAPS